MQQAQYFNEDDLAPPVVHDVVAPEVGNPNQEQEDLDLAFAMALQAEEGVPPEEAETEDEIRARKREELMARLEARYAEQDDEIQEVEEEEEEEEEEEVLPRQVPRYVNLRFVNNVKQPVDVFWIKIHNPNILVCQIDGSGNIVGHRSIGYPPGTPLLLKWCIDGEIHTQFVTVDSPDRDQEVHIGESEETRWKHGALKLDFLMKELIRMGGGNETKYPNLAPIVDMHQDIHLPSVTEIEKEAAGIPSELTNAV
jgi:hypothetical protein